MTADNILIVVALLSGLTFVICTAALLLLREAARQDLDSRVRQVSGLEHHVSSGSRSLGGAVSGLLHRLGNAVRRGTRLYSEDDLATLEGMISAAGQNPRRVLPMVLGLKVVMMLIVPVGAYIYAASEAMAPMLRVAAVVVALPVGLLIPDWLIGIVRRPYVAGLRRGVADALDLLVVCTEAGMGLESALEQVSREMRHSNRPMASALSLLLDELKVLPDRRDALTRFGKRSGVEGIRRMSTMLAQSLQYGTPLGQALRGVAGELRRERVIRLEERAVRLPALLVFPLVFFIMPSLFIVMGGIPVLGLLDMLTSMTGGK